MNDFLQKRCFRWIELAALLPGGKMVRGVLAGRDNLEAINNWRKKYGNTNIFTTVQLFEKDDLNSAFIAPVFFDIDSPDDLEKARSDTLKLCELTTDRLEIGTDMLEIYFSGSKGFHVTIPPEVFDAFPSRYIMELYNKMALKACSYGIETIDRTVYTHRRLWRIPNSINSKSGLYKIPLLHKELLHLSADQIAKLAEHPRSEDSFVTAKYSNTAGLWYRKAIRAVAKAACKTTATTQDNSDFKQGWRIPPCIENIQSTTLPDGIRHQTYLALARFYRWINMHPEQIIKRIRTIDSRQPIDDPDFIKRIAFWAHQHPGFAGCTHPVMQKYCSKESCFYYRIKAGRKHGSKRTK
ncbi:DNA primase small subunit [Anaerohalosphaera lusitana]|uniref:DNA primase small subunit n=1 Tax=Anaerohalosphaera lusitana TaxID=1936003 RepID=A0A1U9NLI8_9BACT|nr:hypothetical protein [Anaerohalosphaera lusitana]AQT68695.1 DNA primase small subunit [Anaerohalosphaera lusitana]